MIAVHALIVVFTSLFAALGNTLFKSGATRDPGEDPLEIGHMPRTMIKPAVLGGIAAYAVSQLLWITVLRFMDLSLAYPLQTGLNFTLIMTVAWLHFREPMSAGKLGGIILIMAGIALAVTG
ncbi:MAG: DMT family transporter [Thermoleophilia bacterium]